MRAIIFSVAILTSLTASAQDTATIYIVENQFSVPLEEWYVLEGEENDNMFYMDFEDREHAEIQIDSTLNDIDADFDSGTLVEMGDGLFYIEWDGYMYGEDGNRYSAYFVYMYSENNDKFHRISVQYSTNFSKFASKSN